MDPRKLKTAVIAGIFAALAIPSTATPATVSKSYSYFNIGGNTLPEIENELSKRGPQVNSTGRRHPGATTMEFTTRLSIEEGRRCRIADARVTVKAKIKLPRWRARRAASVETATVWDTLSSDIKRHEESHVIIAKNHAREMEQALKAMSSQRDCAELRQKAKSISERVLAKHDEAQERFDRVEGINFESRMLRLLRYRIERIENGRIAPSK